MGHVQSFADYFAVAFHITSTAKERSPWDFGRQNVFKLGEELRRLGFNLKKTWRITTINDNYQ